MKESIMVMAIITFLAGLIAIQIAKGVENETVLALLTVFVALILFVGGLEIWARIRGEPFWSRFRKRKKK